jgi:hypothetical protein
MAPKKAASKPGYLSLYCYMWDVLDEGVNSFANLAKDLGLTNISMASTYHGGKCLQPHNKKHHVYFIEEGAVYFPPDDRFFANTVMKPRVSRLVSARDCWREIVAACEKRGIGTTAWSVFLHNSYLGTAYPEYTTQNAFGDRYFHALCPSQPAVMDYLRALAGNLAAYPIQAVEFECFEFVPFHHYSFLQKEGAKLTPFADTLMSVCFCPACAEQAKRSKVNAGAVAKRTKAWLEQYFNGQHREEKPIEARIAEIPGLAEYFQMRFGVLSSGLADIAGILKAQGKRVIYIDIGQEERLNYMSGLDLEQAAASMDAIEMLFYQRKLSEAPGIVRRIRSATGNKPQVYFAVRPGYPDVERATEVVSMSKAVRDAGVDGISYYNFGLLEKPHMDWIKKAIRAL